MRLRLTQVIVIAFALAGCGLPRDPNHTLEHVRGTHVLRAGVAEDPPFIERKGDDAQGIEADVIRGFAAESGARVEWHWEPQEKQFELLEKNELDLAGGGITSKTPWKKKIAITRPYVETKDHDKRALAAPPGENAFIEALEKYLAAHHDEIASRTGVKP